MFAGVGFVALPMDMVREWWGRPRATIPKSEFLVRAMDMARKAKSVQVSLCVICWVDCYPTCCVIHLVMD